MAATSDTLVIGAGVYGLSCAWELALQGRSVTVLDRAPVGTEASGFALGRLDPLLKGSGSTGSTEKDLPPGHIAKPAAQAQLARVSYDLHMELTPEIEEVSGVDVQVDRQPTLQLFYSEEERRFGESYAAEWTSQGFKTDVLVADDIRRIDARIAAPEHGGALVHGPYFINSLLFVRALAACANSAGARLETAHVTEIEAGDVTRVHTDQGHYEAETVVLAAGPWSAKLLEPLGVRLPVHPSKGEILRMEPPRGGPFGVHVHGPCSLVLKKDGLLWVAATAAEEGFDRSPTEWAEERLLSNARKMMPESAGSAIKVHTVCFRPATRDDMPVVGRLPAHGNLFVATGGGGSGIMQCLFIGRQVEEMVRTGNGEPSFAGIGLSRFG